MSDYADRHRRAGRRARSLRLVGVVAAAALALPVLTAASSASSSASSSAPPPTSQKRTLTVGLTQDVDSLNPFVGILASSYEIYQLAYDTLTEYGANDFSPKPDLATKWTTSPDGLTWTYTIRKGSSAVIIGATRWDRADGSRRWVASDQEALDLPPGVAALPTGRPLRTDQAGPLPAAQHRRGHPERLGHLRHGVERVIRVVDRQHLFVHVEILPHHQGFKNLLLG